MSDDLRRHAFLTRDMEPHLETLSRLADDRWFVAEFGVRTGVSTWALLDAIDDRGHVWSWDIEPTIPSVVPPRIYEDPRWRFIKADSATARCADQPDLVFIDTDHEYHHTLAELAIADGWRTPTIVLHDWNLPDVADAVRGFCDRSRYRIEGIEPSEWGMVWLRRS